MMSQLWPSTWFSCPFAIPPSVSVHFLAFWHYGLVWSHCELSLPLSWNQPSLQGVLGPFHRYNLIGLIYGSIAIVGGQLDGDTTPFLVMRKPSSMHERTCLGLPITGKDLRRDPPCCPVVMCLPLTVPSTINVGGRRGHSWSLARQSPSSKVIRSGIREGIASCFPGLNKARPKVPLWTTQS